MRRELECVGSDWYTRARWIEIVGYKVKEKETVDEGYGWLDDGPIPVLV